MLWIEICGPTVTQGLSPYVVRWDWEQCECEFWWCSLNTVIVSLLWWHLLIRACSNEQYRYPWLKSGDSSSMGSGNNSVVRALDLWSKGYSSNPCRGGGRMFFTRVDFLCWLFFQYLFHPCVTAVAHKRSQSICQKCMWQVTVKHTCTLCMWLCMKWHGAWLYGVHRTCRDGNSFMWYQSCQHCKYTTLVDIQKHAIHSCRITCERSESAQESGE